MNEKLSETETLSPTRHICFSKKGVKKRQLVTLDIPSGYNKPDDFNRQKNQTRHQEKKKKGVVLWRRKEQLLKKLFLWLATVVWLFSVQGGVESKTFDVRLLY